MKKSTTILSIVLGLFLIAILIYSFGGFKQSFLSLSTVSVGTDGQVYWVYTATATSPGETYNWIYLPSGFTKTDGTQITPQKSISLSVTPRQPLCNYQLTPKTQSYGLLGLSSVTYYQLNNPEKKINVDFTDQNTGTTQTLDGTVQSSVTFNANGGSLVVQTQGLLSGKFNCPEYSNEILLKFGNGQYGFYKYSDFKTYFDSNIFKTSPAEQLVQTLFLSQNNFNQQVGQDSTFTNSFSAYPSLSGNVVTGSINFGFPVFTISANQKYFASTSYLPPTNAKPVISSISIPSQIQQNSQSSIIVNLINNGNNGNTIITPSSSDLTFSPSSINLILGTSGSQTFNVESSNNVGSHTGTVQVCAVDQFQGNTNCNSKSFSYTITQAPANTFCGDGICQTNENNATCPSDCHIITPSPTPNQPGQCGAWVSLPAFLGGGTLIPNLFCLIGNWFNNLFAPLKWILAIIGGLLSGLLGYKFSGEFFKKKKEQWISIVLGIVLGIGMGILIFVYFWWGLLTLIVLAIIKGVVPI